ncbi:WD40 repeat-like protein [Aureobasidium pullulans]|nr:WD40 repeat-like protein [Aureobasidium pullulans]
MDKFDSKSISSNASRSSTLTKAKSLFRNLSISRGKPEKQPAADSSSVKNPYGLNTLSEPGDADSIVADFIFIHGLGGGSRKTWTRDSDPELFWPQKWLPHDSAFEGVGIHSFGYNAEFTTMNPYFKSKNVQPLSVDTYGESLVEEIHSHPGIKDRDTPLVFIAHSMGGLVLKRACILLKTNDRYLQTRKRLHSFYFLGTPHRGAELANILGKILSISFGTKRYVEGLKPHSELIASLNDQFRLHYKGIHIETFYETQPVIRAGLRSIIVDRESATLGYTEEASQLLNANHTDLTKFLAEDDQNYRTVRNRLAMTMENIRKTSKTFGTALPPVSRGRFLDAQLDKLRSYLNISTAPEDILSSIPDVRVDGSCEWLTNKRSFKDWLESRSPRYLWLEGSPGTGKTMLSTHVIHQLRDDPVCYHFFGGGEHQASSLGSFLSSIAYQMAKVNSDVRNALLELVQQGSKLDIRNHRSVWHTVFIGCVFRKTFSTTHYWVVDALDELVDGGPIDEYFSILSKIDKNIPLKVFITSRPSKDLTNLFGGLPVISERIEPDNTRADIRLYVTSRSAGLPASSPTDRNDLVDSIVQKSGGNFLWTKLVMKELQTVYTKEQIDVVLSQVPRELRDLYIRDISRLLRSKSASLAKTMLTWAMCSVQALTVDEMKDVVALADMHLVRDLSSELQLLCGQFLDVDQFSRIQVAHPTARAFLLSEDCDEYFRIIPSDGNHTLALACLRHLSGKDFAPTKRRGSAVRVPARPSKNLITNYACLHFTYHLSKTKSSSDELFDAVAGFFSMHLLFWIEQVARLRRLDCLISAAKHLSNYLSRRSKYAPMIQDNISSWAVDLPRLVTQFGVSLLESPVAIHTLVPPFCPRSSAIYQVFGKEKNGIRLTGSWHVAWDDRISSILFHEKYTKAIACVNQHFAVGLEDGTIMLYRTTTCEHLAALSHGESIRVLRFSSTSRLLAVASLKRVSLWDVIAQKLLWSVATESETLALAFDEEESWLMAATRAEVLFVWQASDGRQRAQFKWYDASLDEKQANIRRTPQAVKISIEHNVMAVVYRSRPVQLWAVQDHRPAGVCVRPSDQRHHSAGHVVNAVALNPDPSLSLMAVAYWDGEIMLYDTRTCKILITTTGFVQQLTSSPNGRTLAGSDGEGGINLYDFESLQLLHCIRSRDGPALDLVFTSDSLRILDIRATQANVWEPSVLVSQDVDASSTSEPTDSVLRSDEDSTALRTDDLAIITALRCCDETKLGFCGRSNGNVDICDLRDPVGTLRRLYMHRGSSTSVTRIEWNPYAKVVVSADSSSAFRVTQLIPSGIFWNTELLFEDRLGQGIPISQILIHPKGSLMLVSSPEADSIWSVEEKRMLVSHRRHQSRSWKWLLDPSDSSRLILVDDAMPRLYSWENLEALPMPGDSLSLSSGDPRDRLDVDSISIASAYNNLVFTHKPQSAKGLNQADTTKICVLDLAPLRERARSGQPSAQLYIRNVADIPNVELVLGTFRKFEFYYLLFVSTTGWICSVEIDELAVPGKFQKYFFIPSVWRSGNSGLTARIMRNHDIVFVHNEEIVVVENGLNDAEWVDLGEAYQR